MILGRIFDFYKDKIYLKGFTNNIVINDKCCVF